MKTLLLLTAAPIAAFACTGSDPDPIDPAPTRTITARDALTLRGADGSTTATAVDLDRAVTQALVRADDGTWRVIPGEGTSAGDITLAGVPVGDAIVRVDYHDTSPEPRPRNDYFLVGGDGDVALDLGTWRTGRGDAAIAATAPTDLQLDVSNLAAWQAGNDLVVIYLPNLDFVNVFDSDIPDAVTGMPVTGATAAEVHVDWVNAVSGPLADADRGDRGYLMQFRFRPIDGVFVGAPVRAAALPAYTQHDGAPTAVAAALAEPTALRVRLALDRAAFDALRAGVSPDAGPAAARGFSIEASPSVVSEEFSPASLPAQLVVVDDGGVDGTGAWDLGDLDVASPFAATGVYGRFISVYPVPMPLPGLPAEGRAEIGVITPAIPTQAAPATPLIGPVRSPTIGGRDAFSAPTGVGVTPTIAWQPPALGIAAAYEVKLLAPGGADPTYGFGWYPVATFHLPGDITSLELPPEIVVAGVPHAIAIRAIAQALPADRLATAPRQLALPFGWADTITPAFEP